MIPAEQGWQSDAPRRPSVEKPASQSEHSTAPSFSEVLPAEHRLHMVAFPEENDPLLHRLHDVVPFLSEKLPAAHPSHTAEPSSL